jgi:hypothetical protein
LASANDNALKMYKAKNLAATVGFAK